MAEKEQQAQNAPQAAEEKPPAPWGTRAWMAEVHREGRSVLHNGGVYTPDDAARLPTDEQIAADAAARDAGSPRQQTLEARIAELEAQLRQQQSGEDRSKAGVNADRREATGGSAPGESKGK